MQKIKMANRHHSRSPQQIHWERVKGYRAMIEDGHLSVNSACDIIGTLQSSLSYIDNEVEAEPIPINKSRQYIFEMLSAMTESVETVDGL